MLLKTLYTYTCATFSDTSYSDATDEILKHMKDNPAQAMFSTVADIAALTPIGLAARGIAAATAVAGIAIDELSEDDTDSASTKEDANRRRDRSINERAKELYLTRIVGKICSHDLSDEILDILSGILHSKAKRAAKEAKLNELLESLRNK